MLLDYVRLARPAHWIKNGFVLLPILFARRFDDLHSWQSILLATLAFCFAASAVYVFNDLYDRETDRLHPRKKNRPLPAGRISTRGALVEGVVLLALALATAYSVNRVVLAIVVAYLALQALYTPLLKHKMIVDVIIIALCFVLRAAAGAAAIAVEISPWLLVCTFTLTLFMGFCKRRAEVQAMSDPERAQQHRKTLASYTPEFLTHLTTLSAAVAIMSYLQYTLSPVTIDRFGTPYLSFTLPGVIYGICRFAMLTSEGVYHDPTELVLRDWPMQLVVVLWAAASLVIIVYGPAIQAWLVASYAAGAR